VIQNIDYFTQHKKSSNSADICWEEQAELIAWYKKPETILSINSEG
jgi:propionyl-CoA synthetase